MRDLMAQQLVTLVVAGDVQDVDPRKAARGDRRGTERRLDLLGRARGEVGQRVGAGTGDAPDRHQRRGTRPAPVPASLAGPAGAAMPRTRMAFRPRLSFSRPSEDPTSSPVSSRTRASR